MTRDISGLLREWPYDPSSINARWIVGEDGRLRVQLRLDLGIFQMEADGRPDGRRPFGYPSLLDYHQAQIAEAKREHQVYTLDEEQCAELQQEAVQYYYRYLSFFALRNFEGVIADTRHNLDLIELVSEYAEDPGQVYQFLQLYPYVRMMNARCQAEVALRDGNQQRAVEVLQEGLDDLRAYWSEVTGTAVKPEDEMRVLSNMLREVLRKRPKTPEEVLREQLSNAIAEEDYERAAELRDKLRKLGADQTGSEAGSSS